MPDRNDAQQVALDRLLQRQVEGDESARDRRGARATVGLQHVAVHHDGALSHQRHVDRGSQGAADQALDFLGAPVHPTGPRFAGGARLRRPRQHRVLGSDPAFTGPLLVRRRLVVPARGAEHASVTHVDER